MWPTSRATVVSGGGSGAGRTILDPPIAGCGVNRHRGSNIHGPSKGFCTQTSARSPSDDDRSIPTHLAVNRGPSSSSVDWLRNRICSPHSDSSRRDGGPPLHRIRHGEVKLSALRPQRPATANVVYGRCGSLSAVSADFVPNAARAPSCERHDRSRHYADHEPGGVFSRTCIDQHRSVSTRFSPPQGG
jgi:hypothetical protein